MPASPSPSREDRVVFSREEENFTVRDVVDWALVRGDLDTWWQEFLHALECERRASEQGLETDDSAIDSAAVAFRYEHDLITAEETERWLEDRCLDLEEFGDFFARRYWAQAFGSEVTKNPRSYLSATPEERDVFLAELTLSGALDRLAEQMAFRLAAHAAQEKTAGNKSEDERRVGGEKMQNRAEWLEQMGREPQWLDEMLAAEAAFQDEMSWLITEKALERELLAMRFNLTRLTLETVEVESHDAAAEVMACVRSDGMEMSEVAEESRYPFRCHEVLLEDLPPEQQHALVSVKAGALLEPIPREDGLEIWRVKSRTEPLLSDSKVRQRLEEQISRRHFTELVNKHIDWKLLQPVSE